MSVSLSQLFHHPWRRDLMIGFVLFLAIHSRSLGAQEQEFGASFQDTANGVMVTGINANGPLGKMTSAYSNGFSYAENGDVIVEVNGVAVRNRNELKQQLTTSNGSVSIGLRNVRNGQVERYSVRLNAASGFGQMGGGGSGASVLGSFGVSGSVEFGGGFKITSVVSGSPASNLYEPATGQGGIYLESGDVIVNVNGQPIYSNADWENGLRQLQVANSSVSIGVRDIRTGKIRTFVATAPANNDGLDKGMNNNVAGRKVHVLVCGATNEGNGDYANSVRASIGLIQNVIQKQVPNQNIGSNTTLVDGNCNANSILDAIQRINAGPDDTIFVYYNGHGAYDPASGKHYLDFRSNDLFRSDIARNLDAKRTRLTVLITDSCNVPKASAPSLIKDIVRNDGVIGSMEWPLAQLLLNYGGKIDINSSAKDELAMGDGKGGIFTQNFVEELRPNSRWDWIGLIQRTSEITNQKYRAERDRFYSYLNSTSAELNKPEVREQRALYDRQDKQQTAAFSLDVSPR